MLAPKTQAPPGNLDLIQAFINTVDIENPQVKEDLRTPEAARAWLLAHGLIESGGPLSESDRLELIAFRESLRAAALANTGDGDRRSTLETVWKYASDCSFQLSIDGDVPRFTCADGIPKDEAIGQMLGILYDSIKAGSWGRLKACRKDTCQFAFYDHSKNGSGVWCSMAVCGNRVKAQRRRARANANPAPQK